MKKVLSIGVLLCSACTVYAQDPVAFKGKVSGSGHVLQHAQVTVLDDTGKILALIFADSAGVFDLKLKAGNAVQISQLGYRTLYLTFADFRADFNEFVLEVRSKELAELRIVRQALTYESDRIVYAFTPQMPFQGKTLLQTIENVPMLFFDEKRLLHFNGNSNLAFTLNGKSVTGSTQSIGSFLSSIPTEKVLKVEIVTDVPAKYRAKGAMSVVNIVTTKDIEGISFSAKGGINSRWGHMFGGDIGVRTQKFGLSGSFNQDYTNTYPGTFQYTTQFGTVKHQEYREVESSNRSVNTDVRFSYEPDSMTLVNVSVVGYLPKNYGNNEIFTGNESASVLRSKQISKNGFADFSLDVERLLGIRKHVLTASFNHNRSIQDWSFANTDSSGRYSGDVRSRGRETVLQADLLYRFKKIGWFEVGLRNIHRLYSSENAFSYTQNIASNYYGMRYNTSSKQFFRVGLRLEYTSFDRMENRFNLIPSASWSKVLPKNRSLGLSYALGLKRPQLAQVNPTVNRGNPHYISYGNPDLEIEKIQQLTLTYATRLFKSPLSLSAYASRNPNAVQNYLLPVDAGTFGMTYANSGRVLRYGATAYFSKTLFKKLTFRINYQGGYQGITNTQSGVGRSNFEYRLFGTLSYRTQKAYTFSFNTYTYSKSVTYQGYNGGFSDMRLSVSKWFLSDRLSVRSVLYQPFSSTIKIRNSLQDELLSQHSVSEFSARYVGLELSYYFQKGKDEIVKTKKRGIVHTDK